MTCPHTATHTGNAGGLFGNILKNIDVVFLKSTALSNEIFDFSLTALGSETELIFQRCR